MIKKVDRVASVEQAKALASAGATHLCVDWVPRPNLVNRIWSETDTQELLTTFADLRVGIHLDPEALLARQHEIAALAPQFVQLASPAVLSPEVLQALDAIATPTFLVGMEASYEDDPGWILSRYEDALSRVSLFQVEALTDLRNAWRRWKTDVTQQADELQIADVDTLAAAHPVVLSIDFSPGNVAEILVMMPHLRGIAFNLALPDEETPHLHLQTAEGVRAILRQLHN